MNFIEKSFDVMDRVCGYEFPFPAIIRRNEFQIILGIAVVSFFTCYAIIFTQY